MGESLETTIYLGPILALEFASPDLGLREEASVGTFLMALTGEIAGLARAFGLRLGVQHEHRLSGTAPKGPAETIWE